MEKDKSFYIHLCSTDSMNTYPNNASNNFVNLLAKPLELNEGFEVGLVEMQFTNNIFNVTKNSNFALFDFLYEWKSETEDKTTYWGRLYDAKVPEGQYDDV